MSKCCASKIERRPIATKVSSLEVSNWVLWEH